MKNKKIYIDVPPPTISGDLHIGHIFSYTQADIVKSFFEKMGSETHYPFCFDNNGLSTIKLSEKNKRRDVLNFSIEKSEESYEKFSSCGILLDKNESYHTLSDKTITIVHEAFKILLEKGIIYKEYGEYLWSNKMRSSVSQSELDENGLIEKTGEKPEIINGECYYLRMLDFKEKIMEMVNKIKWHPNHCKSKIINWVI